MMSPEVDQELERLLSVAREATTPDASAKERIHAALTERLAHGGGTIPKWRRPAGLAFGAVVVGICGGALWLASSTPAPPSRAAVTTASISPSFAPRVVALLPAVEAAAPVPVASMLPAPSVFPERQRAAAPSSRAGVSGPSAAAPADELLLVRSMQQALRAGNAGQALSLAAEHARTFPRGALIEEREGVRAVAQCKLALPERRATIAESFLRRFGSSPYAARVKAACQ
jgi:hypothetical protein